jgi:2-polyprenyl-6-methoxyphenol hydroxylase-like FAD-dependent oxidoreductase
MVSPLLKLNVVLMRLQYGKELADIEYGPDGNGVTAIFKDGTKAIGTMIIGADGPRSSVRNILLGEDKASITPLGVVHANIAVKFHDAEKSKFVRSAHQSFSMVTHPDCLNFISSKPINVPYR